MRLAASNIAWPAEADDIVAALLREHGMTGVELAPGKLWPRPIEAGEADALAVRRRWESHGIRIVALQALLFGRPDLTLFDGADVRRQTVEYLGHVIRLAGWLGAGVLVFGSPRNRRIGARPAAEVWPVAVDVFRQLGERAAEGGVCLCIEANPAVYDCDFVTTVAAAAELVAAVDHPGFGLHLDAGGMILGGESPTDAGSVRPRHFHVSAPHLAVPDSDIPRHTHFAGQLRQMGFDGYCSLEQRQTDGDWLAALRLGLDGAQRHYG